MKFFDLFSGEDISVIHFNGGVLLDPFAKSGLGNAVFFAELGLCFAVLVK